MAEAVKTIKMGDHVIELKPSGFLFIRYSDHRTGCLIDAELAKVLGPKVEKLFQDGEALKVEKEAPKSKKTAKTPIADPGRESRIDLLAHQFEVMQRNQMEMMKMMQSFAQSQPQLIDMSK